MAPSSDLVVLAARRATHVTVLDVLRDWSSLGLVGPVCLVDVDSIRADELRIPAIVLESRGFVTSMPVIRAPIRLVICSICTSRFLSAAAWLG